MPAAAAAGTIVDAVRFELEAEEGLARALCLELLDIAIDEARRATRSTRAVRLLQRAGNAEPHDEARYVRLASLLASQGGMGSALETVRRARAALAELGLEPTAALTEAERSFSARLRS